MKFLIFFVTVMLLAAALPPAHAKDVTLAWDANTEPDIAGYKIYYNVDTAELPFAGSESSQGASPVDVGNVTATTLTGLDSSKTHYFAVTAYDTDGYESSFSNIVSALESVPPTIAIAAPAPATTISGMVTITVNASDNSGDVKKVEILLGDTAVATFEAAPYAATVDTLQLANGIYTIKALATDSAGTTAETAATYTVFNDTTVPTVSVSSPVADALVKGTKTIAVDAADNVGVTKVEWYLDGTLQQTKTAPPYIFTWQTSSASDGPHSLAFFAYDAAGNTGTSGSYAVRVVNLPAKVAITSPVSGWKFKKTVVTAPVPAGVSGLTGEYVIPVEVSAASGAGVSKVGLYVNGKLVEEKESAPYTFSWNAAAVNGTRTLTAKVYDGAGRVAMSAKVPVLVSDDVTGPVVKVYPAAGKTVTGNATVKVSAKDPSGIAQVDLYVDEVLLPKTKSLYRFKWNTAGYDAAKDHVLKAVVWDKLGNKTESSSTVKVKDIIPPVVPSPPKIEAAGLQVTISADATDNVAVTKMRLDIDGKKVVEQPGATLSYVWDATTAKAGNHSIVVIAYDAAGKSAKQAGVWSKP